MFDWFNSLPTGAQWVLLLPIFEHHFMDIGPVLYVYPCQTVGWK